MKKTIQQVLESIKKDSVTGDTLAMRTVLEDAMAANPTMAELPVDAAVGGKADDQIKAAFRSAVVAAFDDDSLDSKATLAKIKGVLNAYDKLNDKGGDPKPSDKPKDEPAKESVEAKLTRLERTEEIRVVAEAAEVKLTPVQIKAAVALESVEDRAAFVKSLPKVTAEKGSGPPKPPKSSSVNEAAGNVAPPKEGFSKPEDVRNFIRS